MEDFEFHDLGTNTPTNVEISSQPNPSSPITHNTHQDEISPQPPKRPQQPLPPPPVPQAPGEYGPTHSGPPEGATSPGDEGNHLSLKNLMISVLDSQAVLLEWLEEMIENLKKQELAVNSTSTVLTIGGVVSTALLFTPLAPFGVAGLVGTGVGGTAAGLGDYILTTKKGKDINNRLLEHQKLEKALESRLKDFLQAAQIFSSEAKIPLDHAMKIMITVEKNTLSVASSVTSFLKAVDLQLTSTPSALLGVKGSFNLANVSVGLSTQVFGVLGCAVSVGTCIYGWISGNPTKKGAIEVRDKIKLAQEELQKLYDALFCD